MISFNIIFNYFSNISSDDLFKSFLQENDRLFEIHKIDKELLKDLSLECQYVYLYSAVVKASNGRVQFSNEYIENSFKQLTNEYHVDTRIVNIKEEAEDLKNFLIQKEACLSLSCHGTFGWHATPIGYDTEFFTVHQGQYVSLEQDFLTTIKNKFNADDIGDGILFVKRLNS